MSFARTVRPSLPAPLPAVRGEGGRRPGEGLQSVIGNRAVQRLLRLQPRPRLSTRGDAAEQSAHRTADAVMDSGMESGQSPLHGERRAVDGGNAYGEVFSAAGRALDPGTRDFMEARFARDFGRVRVHTEPEAAESARREPPPARPSPEAGWARC